MLANGAAAAATAEAEEASESRGGRHRLKKRRRNGRKNGGAKIWAAACDELQQTPVGGDDPHAPGALVWAKIDALWWPAFVANPEELDVHVLRDRQEGQVGVRFYGRSPDQSFAWLQPSDVVAYHGNHDDLCLQVVPEGFSASYCAALAEIHEAQQRSKVDIVVVSANSMPCSSAENEGSIEGAKPAASVSRKRKSGPKDKAAQEPKIRVLKFKITQPQVPDVPQDGRRIRSGSPLIKKLESDGSYSECMECNAGGDLLCCDTCPRVYHLECLVPPLKKAPHGKWHCPTCNERSPELRGEKSVEMLSNHHSNEAKEATPTCKVDADPKIQKRRRDDSTKRNKQKRSKTEAPLDKLCPPCGLNKQSTDALLDSAPFEEDVSLFDYDDDTLTSSDKNPPSCDLCGDYGDLSTCDRCIKSYHLICLGLPPKKPKGRWACCFCVSEKKKKDDQVLLPVASSEVDRIVGCRIVRVASDEATNSSEAAAAAEAARELEFQVKWVGRSHIHNEWLRESELKTLAKRKLENYKAKHGTAPKDLVDEKWTQPQRVIGRRKAAGDGVEEVLVKWNGLPYDECTWEVVGDDEPRLAELSAKLDEVEKEALASSSRAATKKAGGGGEIATLEEQPSELQGGSLFPHQMEALNWLRKCWHKKKNVILADEMGLGKTISACAFLSSLHHEFKVKGPCLVLVPLSTMPNWLAEFALWAPGLNVIEYHGSVKARAVIRQYEWHTANHSSKKQRAYKFKVMLTNYETVITDPAPLRSLPWEVLLVDEGHRLKNSGSKLFTLLNTFSFGHRVLMTGTPMQNNLGEMYNLLNFLLPEKFPSLAAFQEKFSSLSTAEQVEEIRKLVAPHMLRRLKKDAMQGIPPKAERVVLVELTSVQAEYYRALLTKNFQLLRQGSKSQQSMINIIMQLRKVCNHPYLIPGTEPDHGTPEFLHEMRIKASAKLTLLHSVLGCLKAEGHRVLIFSQMTKLLDVLEDYLTFEFGQDSFERVDGSVPVGERQAAINRFNRDVSRFVFLLSTRSCGLGINLATADTVIIYDSDFNPHADIQAMNRAHRIGQSKKLLVYRLVVQGSVEERILHLAKKKLELDQLFASKSGSQKEIEDILQWGTDDLFQQEPADGGDSPATTDPAALPASTSVVPDEGDGKSKKKVGGLGDVYNDKCHEAGRSKIVWDEPAIKRLLDRSSVPDAEADTENDMLGSIKAWDCNEPDQGGDEQQAEQPVPDSTEQTVVHQKTQEENKWEKLLRIRWEKLQTEEEAVLGRGKRLRKIISYNEGILPLQKSKEVSSESDEVEEPEPEYSPAGQAMKIKLAKLRARQKERIALRYAPAPPPLDKSFLAGDAAKAGSFSRYLQEALPHYPEASTREMYSRNYPHEVRRVGEHFLLPEPVDESLMQKALASRLSRMAEETADKMASSDLNLFPGSLPPSLPEGVSHAAGLRQLLPALSRPPFANGFSTQGLPVHFDNPSRSFLHGPFGGGGGGAQETSPPDLAPPSFHRKPDDIRPVDLNLDVDNGYLETDVTHHSSKSGRSDTNFASSKGARNLSTSLDLGLPTFCNPPDKHYDREMVEAPPAPRCSRKGSKSRAEFWTEDELDALWTGVRRHGRGNWINMLQDPRLCFSRFRTAKDLAERWEEEQARLLAEPPPPPPPPPSSLPSMIGERPQRDRSKEKRNRSRKNAFDRKQLENFRSKGLGLPDRGDLPGLGSKLLPNFADFNFSSRHDGGGDSASTSKMNFPMDRPELVSRVLERLQEAQAQVATLPPLPNFKVKGEPDLWKEQPSSSSVKQGGGARSSSLPHWLKEAVTVAPPPEPALSPHIAAVAQAVSILHKSQKPLLAPWTQSWHPLVPPRELPKKKKKHFRQVDLPKLPGSTHFPPVHIPNFSFSRSLLEPLTMPPIPFPGPIKTSSSNCRTITPLLPELPLPSLPLFRPKYLDPTPQQPQGLPRNFGISSQQQQQQQVKAELPPWLAPPTQAGNGTAAAHSSSSETQSDPGVKNKEENEEDASSEGTVSDDEVQNGPPTQPQQQQQQDVFLNL